MRPVLFSLGLIELNAYPSCLVMGFVAVVYLLLRENERGRNPLPITAAIGFWTLAGAMVGARLLCWFESGMSAPLYRVLVLWQGGYSFYGGLADGTLAIMFYARYCGAPFIPVLALAMRYGPVGGAITRIGCFLSGCCWGRPTDLPWGVRFPVLPFGAYSQQLTLGLLPSGATRSLAVHPTQLYSVAAWAILFLVLRRLHQRGCGPAAIVAAFLFFYGCGRFVIECFRADNPPVVLGLTIHHLISLGLVVFTPIIFILVAAWRKRLAKVYETH